MRGRYVPARELRRLAWAWAEFMEEDGGQDIEEVHHALRQVVGSLWPGEREQARVRALRQADTTYLDRYPSGLVYTACGAPHSSGDPSRKCSRRVEDGAHYGRQDVGHMNHLGNQWQ